MKILPFVSILIFIVACAKSPEVEKSQQQKQKMDDYLQQATHYYNKLVFDTAAYYYDSATNIARQIDDKVSLADINRLKGRAFLRAGQKDLATLYLYKSKTEAEQIGNDTILANVKMLLAYILAFDRELDSALAFYNSAYALFEHANDTAGMAKVRNNLTIYYNKSAGEPEKALEIAIETYRGFLENNQKELIARSLINLGNVYLNLKEFDTALSCYNQSLGICIEIDNAELISKNFTNRAIVYYKWNKYEEAIAENEKAIEYYEGINNTSELDLLYSNVGMAYSKSGQFDKAIAYARKSLELANEENDTHQKTKALNNLGIIYSNQKNYVLSEEYFLQSLKLAEDHSYLSDQKKVYSNLAGLYETKQDYKTAYDYYQKYTKVNQLLVNEHKASEIAKLQAIYDNEFEAKILSLEVSYRLEEEKRERIQKERNSVIGLAIFIASLLIWLALYFRMKIKKNRIIAAQKIQQLEDEKKLLAAQSVLMGQEKERKRIAQELHDGIGVLLSTASIHFSGVEQNTEDNKTNEMVKKAKNLLSKAGGEVRKISQNMMPGVLSKFGLREAVEDLFDELEESGKIRTEVTMICNNARLPEDMEIMIYRIVQEMINNTLKHANAIEITCRFKRDPELILIDYSDNGKGFDTDNLPHNKSLGIYGIRSRVDFLNGELELVSEIGKGTSYHIRIPVLVD